MHRTAGGLIVISRRWVGEGEFISLLLGPFGNGNPLQCSCLESPGDSRAQRAAVYGVAQSQTRLACRVYWRAPVRLLGVVSIQHFMERELADDKSFKICIWSSLDGLPRWLSGKESSCRRCRLDLWVGKDPWRRECNPLQYSCMENSKDRGAW